MEMANIKEIILRIRLSLMKKYSKNLYLYLKIDFVARIYNGLSLINSWYNKAIQLCCNGRIF